MGSLVLAGASSGSTTISPTDAVTATLTLPNATGTLLSSASSITATQMPTGSVIQVVQAYTGSYTSSTSTTYANSNLSASITPQFSASRILVLVHQAANPIGGVAAGYGYQTNIGIQLLRGATVLTTPAADSGGAYSLGFSSGVAPSSGIIVSWGYVDFNYLDSPATTSSVTYSTQFRAGLSGMTVYVNSCTSFITLMEIR